MAKHKGCKDKKPRLRRSAPVRIIEKRMKENAPAKTELAPFNQYLEYRRKVLQHLKKAGKPVKIKVVLWEHMKLMIAEGTVSRVGPFYSITAKGHGEC